MSSALSGLKTALYRNPFTAKICRIVHLIRRDGILFYIRRQYRRAHPYTLKHFNGIIGTKTPESIDGISFSIVTALYNTPEKYLRCMLDSVVAQTYPDWELCLADASDSEHDYVGDIVGEYALRCDKIKYNKLKQNYGIAQNTNISMESATGTYIALLDHDDLLHPSALSEAVKQIAAQGADFLYSDEATFDERDRVTLVNYKPDFAPDTLRSYNYICHLSIFSRALFDRCCSSFDTSCDGSQDYDVILRMTEKAEKIVHIPEVLYFWRSHSGSTAMEIAAKPYVMQSAKTAISRQLNRLELDGEVVDSAIPSTYRIRYKISGSPLVSIMIPNRNMADTLSMCIDSITKNTAYRRYEIIIVENNSNDDTIFEYYQELQKRDNIRIITAETDGSFNFSRLNNLAAKNARGEHLVMLNNDTTVISPEWLDEMLMFSQRDDMGAVGAMLLYPDNTVQHGGVILGVGGIANHAHLDFPADAPGYMSRLTIAQNLSAVTAACLMVKRSVYEKVGGCDEEFAVAFNDIDFCLRLRETGLLNVWTPYARLYHHESKSRGRDTTPEKRARFVRETERFYVRWGEQLKQGDPYYNPNLTLDRTDFSNKNY